MKQTLIWRAGRYDPDGKQNYDLFPAEVPGNVQYDYSKFIGIEDLMYAQNTDALIETEDWYWEYRTVLSLPDGASRWLVFEGIDYRYDILLAGKTIHSGEGMYRKIELDITDLAKTGDVLQVIIHPHPRRPIAEGEHFRSAADRSCKPPVCYGWDWNPRLLFSGLWQPAYIETREKDFIRSVEPTYKLNDTRDTAVVQFVTDCDANVTYSLYHPDGTLLYKDSDPCCRVENVKLWWCNGQGEPHLYHWCAETDSDIKEGDIGFRSFSLAQNEGTRGEPTQFPKSRYAARITPTLNGRRVFAKGSNWVNPELFFGRITEERLEGQIIAAKEANMNILRIWGGAGICPPAFYRLCDKHGIMVWQEFMLACNCYEGSEEYLTVLEREATAIIKKLRPHACLVMWCGGNELFNGWSGMDEQSHALRLLNALCYTLDRERPFLPTSPLSGMAHGGYTFIDPTSGKDCFALFQSSHNTAYTEFGSPAISPVEQLKKILPEQQLFPLRPTPAIVHHHGFYAWRDETWLCLDTLKKYFGEASSLEQTVEQSNLLQCEGYKAIFEEARRQAPYCSMAINWCFQEPWICVGNNSLLSYPDVKKPGYYAVQGSLRPTLVSARIPKFKWQGGEVFSAELWLLNDAPTAAQTTVTATLKLGDTVLATLSWDASAAAGKNKIGPSINALLPDEAHLTPLVLTLEAADAALSSSYTLCFHKKAQKKKRTILNV